MDFDLPICHKWLLVSAYLASHIPPKMDIRIFSTLNTKSNKNPDSKVKTKCLPYY